MTQAEKDTMRATTIDVPERWRCECCVKLLEYIEELEQRIRDRERFIT